jgi:hypothetical protein
VEGRAVSSHFVFLSTRRKTGNPTETNFPIFQSLHHLLDRMVPHSMLRCNFSVCYPSVLSDELVDFFFSVLKMFHPPSDTAGTHADISTKSLVDDSCRVFFFHKKLNDSALTKRHVGDSHFLAVHDGNVRGEHALILRSC